MESSSRNPPTENKNRRGRELLGMPALRGDLDGAVLRKSLYTNVVPEEPGDESGRESIRAAGPESGRGVSLLPVYPATPGLFA